MKNRIVSVTGLTIIVSAICNFAYAQTGGSGGTTITLPNPLGGNCTNLTCPLNKVIDFIFWVSIPICGLMVLIGGFTMLTSAGNPEKVKKGRQTIMYAAIGFVVILLAKGVGQTIRNFLGA